MILVENRVHCRRVFLCCLEFIYGVSVFTSGLVEAQFPLVDPGKKAGLNKEHVCFVISCKFFAGCIKRREKTERDTFLCYFSIFYVLVIIP